MSSEDDEKKGSAAALTQLKPCKEFNPADEGRDFMCGVGSWRPKWIQKAADAKLFLFIYAMAGLAEGAKFSYFVGCLSTLEKRFAYDTTMSGWIIGIEEVAHISLALIVGYLGGSVNKPRLLSFGMLLATISCFIMSFPYFIYGSARLGVVVERPISRIPGADAQICDTSYNEVEDSCDRSTGSVAAVAIFSVAKVLKGISGVIYYTVGTTYVDDSTQKKNSPVFLSIFFACRLLGPTLGYLLSSLCLQWYEDPFYDPGFDTKDPRWIGAWWIGYIVLGVLTLMTAVPIIFFPKHFPNSKIPASYHKKQKDGKPIIKKIKDMGKALVRVFRNPILIFKIVGDVLRLNCMTGYYILIPKYMEMQFRQSASEANLYSGPTSMVGMQIGIILGGVLIRRFRPRPRVLTGGILITESVTVITLICCMLITCPTDTMTGTTSVESTLFNLQNDCNTDCKCTTQVYTPVCGPDGKSTYFSPCFAGCTGYNDTGGDEIFTDCKCVHNMEGEIIVGDAEKSYCGFECNLLIPFVVVLTLGELLASISTVADTLVTLRCVEPQDKGLALGALDTFSSILAFLPAPLIYGALTDSSCLVWEKTCGRTGNCWVYDTDKLRYLLHGVSIAFVVGGSLADFAVWVLSPRLRNLYDDQAEEDAGKTAVEMDKINKGEA